MQKFKKGLVVKDNALNQYTFYKSPVQLKILAHLITDIRDEPNKTKYTLSIKELLTDFWGTKENYTQLKNVCRKMGQMVEIPKEKGFKFSALFYDINTDENGLIEFEVNPNLKPYLLNITNNFTAYDRSKISHLKSFYSIRLYELLKQYQDKTGGGWWKVTLDKLKEILKISEKQYKLYGHLKNKVILVAQKELYEKTDIKFTFEEQKKGRKIEVLTFYISQNNKIKTSIENSTKNTQNILPKHTKNESYEILSKFLKIDNAFINEIYKSYDEKIVLANAKYTLEELKKDNIKTSIGGFLRQALKNNFASQMSLTSIKKEQRKTKENEAKSKKYKTNKIEEKNRLIKKEFDKNITKKVEQYILNNKNTLEPHFEVFKEKFSFVVWDEKSIERVIKSKPIIRRFFINFLSHRVLKKEDLDFEIFKSK